MDYARIIDCGLPIALGIVLLISRRRKVRKKIVDDFQEAQHRDRFRGFPLLMIGSGVLLFAVHSLTPKAKVTIPPFTAWQTVTSTDGVLALTMPGEPRVQTEESESALGRVRRVKHFVGINNDAVVFDFNEMHYLDESLEFDPRSFVDQMAEATVSKGPGVLIREQIMRIDDHDVKEVEIKLNEYIVVMRFFLVGRCLYQVKIVIPEGDINSPIVNQYLNSLSIRSPR